MTKARELSELGSYVNVTDGVTAVNSIAVSSNLQVNVVIANGSVGTAGQMLTSNGSGVYWLSPQLGDITAVVAGSGLTGGGSSGEVTISLPTTGVVANTYGNTSSIPVLTVDTYGRLTNVSTASIAGVTNFTYTAANNTFDISTSGGSNFLATIAAANATTSGVITVIDSVINTSILIAASANSVKTAYDSAIAANTRAASAQTAAISAYSNATSYAATIAGTAYSNAVSVASTDATNKAANAYSNAVSYAATIAGTAYSNAVSVAASDASGKAATAYSNAVSTAALDATSKANNAYTTAVAAAASDATSKANNAYTTAVSAASTDATNKAANAYSNATTFASNASNISSGTLSELRLPYRMNQDVRTTDTVQFGNMTVTGNLTVSGTTVTVSANNLLLQDNMIYLNDGNTVANPDLGITGNYNDGTYRHAGFFRDATDGVWKVYDQYLPEPDASPYIDTSNASFRVADFQANVVTMASANVGGATINSTSYSGSANNASYLGTYAASAYPRKSEGATVDGAWNFTNTSIVWSSHSYTNTYDGSNVYLHIGSASSTDKIWNLRVFRADNSVATFAYNGAGRYATAEGSWRAPVFYDTDNTAYYVDATGTSYLNHINTGAGWLYMQYTGSDLLRMNSYGVGFDFFNQTQGYWADLRGRNSYFSLMYDKDNTAYYIDPASTTYINQLQILGGNPVYPAQWTTGYQSSSDFADGTLVTTDIPATASAGDSFIIEIAGKSYDGSNPPFKVVAQGYLYSDTIINYSGISYGGNFASSIKVFEDGGVLKFWWPRISYWNSFNVRVVSMDGPTNNTITRNRITGITNATEPTGTKKQTIALARFMRADVSTTNSVDVRSPIFYDSNDTSYYVNPDDATNLSAVRTRGQIRATGWWGEAYSGSVSGLGIEIGRSGSTSYVLSYNRDSAAYGPMQLEATSFNFVGVGGGYVTVNNSVRTPIFYDSDNTVYYIDGAGTSVLNILRPNTLQFSSGNQAADLTNGSYFILRDPTANPAIYLGGADPANYYDNTTHYFRTRTGSTVATINGNGVYAPVFYDSNDTNYYADPSSNSVLNTLYFRNSAGSNIKALYASYFGYSTSYRTLVVGNEAYQTVCIGVDPISNLSGSFGGAGSGTEVMFKNGVSFITPNSANNSYHNPLTLADGYAASTGSFRAPIFYDSNNTSYYVDPANSTAVYTDGLIVAGQQGFQSRYYAAGRNRIWSFANADTYGISYFQGSGGFDGVNDTIGMHFGTASAAGSQFVFVASGFGQATNSWRAPIFYDSNNTSYYVDPTSTSVMSDAIIGGRTMSTAMFYAGFTLDADTMPSNSTGFTYSVNAPWTGPIMRASAGGGYDLWFNAPYNGGGALSYRTRNGDTSSFNAWKRLTVYDANPGSGDLYAVAYYDANNSSYYLNPNSDSNLYRTSTYLSPKDNNSNWNTAFQNTPPFSKAFHGDYSSGGPAGSWWFYESMRHSNASNYWGTQIAWGWEDNANRLFQRNITGGSFGGWVEYLNTSNRTYNGNLNMTGSIISTSSDMRAPIFYDQNNTAYYINPNSSSAVVGAIIIGPNSSGRYTRIGGDGGASDEATLSASNGNLHIDAKSGSNLYLAWYNTSDVIVGGGIQALIYYDRNNTGYYIDPTVGFSLLGGSGGRVSFTSSDSGLFVQNAEGINNVVRLGAAWGRPGTYSNGSYTLGSESSINFWISAVEKGYIDSSSNFFMYGSARSPIFYDSNDTSYYTDPASASRLSRLSLGGGTGADATVHITGALGGYNRLTQMSPASANLEAFNIMAARDGSNADLWWSWGVDTSNRWRINQGVGFSTNGIIIDNVGNFTAAQNITAYSDISLKTNIQNIDRALEKVCSIRGVTFDRIDLGTRGTGVIAQEVQEVLPEVVLDGEDGIKSVAYGNMVGLLIEAIKELKAEIEELKANK